MSEYSRASRGFVPLLQDPLVQVGVAAARRRRSAGRPSPASNRRPRRRRPDRHGCQRRCRSRGGPHAQAYSRYGAPLLRSNASAWAVEALHQPLQRPPRLDAPADLIRAAEQIEGRHVLHELVGVRAPRELVAAQLVARPGRWRSPVRSGRNAARSVTWMHRAGAGLARCLSKVGVNATGRKRTPAGSSSRAAGRPARPRPATARRTARRAGRCRAPRRRWSPRPGTCPGRRARCPAWACWATAGRRAARCRSSTCSRRQPSQGTTVQLAAEALLAR